MDTLSGLWKDIPLSKGYQVSTTGEVRRKLKTGKYRKLKPYQKKGRYLAVTITLNGKLKEIQVHTLVARAFGLKKESGQVLHFKNGDIHDPSLHNLEYVDKSHLASWAAAKSNRKPVAKLDADGEVVQFYSSARVCAKENYMGKQTILNRCNRKVKSKFAPDGYQYMWEEDVKY